MEVWGGIYWARATNVFWFVALLSVAGLATILVSCGVTGSGMSTGGTGTINVSITDPPSCKFPNSSFTHVYITVRSVQAHTSATADDNSSGWQELAPQLDTVPMQIDLFITGSTADLLTTIRSD